MSGVLVGQDPRHVLRETGQQTLSRKKKKKSLGDDVNIFINSFMLYVKSFVYFYFPFVPEQLSNRSVVVTSWMTHESRQDPGTQSP